MFLSTAPLVVRSGHRLPGHRFRADYRERRPADRVPRGSQTRAVSAVAKLALMLLISVSRLEAQDGILDPTFDGDGRANFDIVPGSDEFHGGIALQGDGRILLAGTVYAASEIDVLLLRLDSSGSLDPTFGSGGAVLLGGPNPETVQTDPLVLPTGEVVYATTEYTPTGDRATLGRILPNGQVDPSFGVGGTTAITTYSARARSVFRQLDGKLILVGDALIGSSTDILVARFHATGSLDQSFGSGGLQLVDLNLNNSPGNLSEVPADVTVDPQGRILVAGTAQYSGPDWDGFVLRLTPSGARDPAFGNNGLAWIFLDWGGDNYDSLLGLDVDARSRAVLSGFAHTDALSQDVVVARLDSSGFLDQSFGTGGWFRMDLGLGLDSPDYLNAVAQDRFGRILATGASVDLNGDFQCRCLRLTADGTLDPSFGANGVVTLSFDLSAPPTDDLCVGLVIQPDGRILISGRSSRGTNNEENNVVARFLNPSTIFWDGFESGDTDRW